MENQGAEGELLPVAVRITSIVDVTVAASDVRIDIAISIGIHVEAVNVAAQVRTSLNTRHPSRYYFTHF